MNYFRRLFISATSRFDNAVTALENHEAVAKEVIGDLERTKTKAVIEQRQLIRKRENLQREASSTAEEAEKWTARAKSLRESNREKALQCLQRAKRATQEKEAFEAQVLSYQSLERDIEKSIQEINTRLLTAQGRFHALAAKQAQNRIHLASHSSCLEIESNFEDLFNRWEISLGAIEEVTPVDSLRDEFEREETDAHLSQELDEL